MITDYSELVDRMQRGLATAWAGRPLVLNTPGVSMACKVDPYHYVAPREGVFLSLAKLSAIPPDKAREALIKTGECITAKRETAAGPERLDSIVVELVWDDKRARIRTCFFNAQFFDHALALYAGQTQALPLAELRIAAEDRELVRQFLAGKSELQALAFC